MSAVPAPVKPAGDGAPGNLAGPVEAVLERFGVVAAPVHDRVVGAVEGFCGARGHRGVEVASFRWGRLTLVCPPSSKPMLDMDRDVLTEALRGAAPGAVTDVRIRVRR